MPRFLPVFEKYLFGLLLGLLVFIPLFPKFPALNVRGTFVAVRWEDFLIAIALLSFGLFLLLSGRIKELLKDRLVQLMLVFFFIGALSSFSAVFLTHTAQANLAAFHFLRRIEMMTLMPMAYFLVRSRGRLLICLSVLAMVVLSVNLYALGQQYLNWPVISTTNSEFSKGQILYLTDGARVSSTFAGHYDLAVFLVMASVTMAALFFVFNKLYIKVSILALGSLSFLVLVMTAARLSFVAALIGIIGSLVLVGKRLFVGLVILVAVLALIYPSQLRDRLISTVTVNLLNEGARYTSVNANKNAMSQLNLPNVVSDPASGSSFLSASSSGEVATDIVPGEPVDSTQLGVYRSFGIRLNVEWPRAMRAFTKNPLLGTGYSSLDLATDNDFLRSLGEVGILGTVAFILIIWESLRRILKVYHRKDKLARYFSAGVIAMTGAFLVNGLFIDVFEASKIAALFWLVLGINMGLEFKDETS